ncbi:MAG: DegT/DnrJ/EryC1/StrS family aminotransferase [Burkholderiales bacterium]
MAGRTIPRKRSSAANAARRELAFLPFARPTIDAKTVAAVGAVLRSGWIASGPKVKAFEAALSRYLGRRPVRAFTSATGALEVALQVCGVGPGDEVIVPAMTFAATANVVIRVGARPVFVDVEIATRNIDPGQSEQAVTARTRAIMPVHFSGLPVAMDALYDLARRRGLRVVEDAAHAIGSRYRGRRIGSFGDLVAFSFHPNKNMTTIEGGALSFADPAEVGTAEQLRFHGIAPGASGEMDVVSAGGKFNLSDVAACIGLDQLPRLEGFNRRRRKLVARYFEHLRGNPALLLPTRGDSGHSWHMFAPLLELDQLRIDRREFIARMHNRGIGVGVHYPALHLFSFYRRLGYRPGQFPNAERIGQSTVTLPLFPRMTLADVDRVCEACCQILVENRR